MDGNKALLADTATAPVITVRDTVDPLNAAPAERSTRLSPAWAVAVGVSAVIFQFLMTALLPLPDDAASPATWMVVGTTIAAWSLLLTPLIALTRSRISAGAGLFGALTFLGFQAECAVGGHVGWFVGWFMAINIAAVALAAVCGAALVRGARSH